MRGDKRRGRRGASSSSVVVVVVVVVVVCVCVCGSCLQSFVTVIDT